MDAVRLYDKFFYQLNAKDYAKTANEAAKRSKKLALQVLSEIGRNSEVTKGDVMRIANKSVPGTFDKSGNISSAGSNELLRYIRSLFHLKSDDAAKKITVREYLKKIVTESKSPIKPLNINA